MTNQPTLYGPEIHGIVLQQISLIQYSSFKHFYSGKYTDQNGKKG